MVLCVSVYASEYKSHIAAMNLHGISRHKDLVRLETEQGTFKVKNHNLSKQLRQLDDDHIHKLLDSKSYYLSLMRDSDDEYIADIKGRLPGGGPITATAAYWTIKLGFYSLIAAGIWSVIKEGRISQEQSEQIQEALNQAAAQAREEMEQMGHYPPGYALPNREGNSFEAPNFSGGYSFDLPGTPFNAHSISGLPFNEFIEEVRRIDPNLANFMEGAGRTGFNLALSSTLPGGPATPFLASAAAGGLDQMLDNNPQMRTFAENAALTSLSNSNRINPASNFINRDIPLSQPNPTSSSSSGYARPPNSSVSTPNAPTQAPSAWRAAATLGGSGLVGSGIIGDRATNLLSNTVNPDNAGRCVRFFRWAGGGIKDVCMKAAEKVAGPIIGVNSGVEAFALLIYELLLPLPGP